MPFADFLKECHLALSLDKDYRLKIGNFTSVTINKAAVQALQSFLPHQLEVPVGRLNQYPGRDTPLVIQIWSAKLSSNNFSDFHGQAHYGTLSVCSDGIGGNNRVGIRPDNQLFTTKIFLLSPELMGLNRQILNKEMYRESQLKNDYDLSLNNCIDHIIRPMKKAGLAFDFGKIATPKRLSEFCEQMVKEKKGVLIRPKVYNFYLKRHPINAKGR